MDQSNELTELKNELLTMREHVQQYREWFNIDNHLAPEEEAVLNDMDAQISRAEERIKELEAEGVQSLSSYSVSRNPLPEQEDVLLGNYQDVTEQSVNQIIEVFNRGGDDATDIHWNDVTQGRVGNCYFLAGIAAVAKTNPEVLRRLIKGPDGQGNYEVSLYVNVQDGTIAPVARTVTITPEFLVDDQGQPIYAGSGDAELWVMLLEKAYALIRGEKMQGVSLVEGNEDGYKKLDAGWGWEAMETLTGKQAVMLWLKDFSNGDIKTAISGALGQNNPITTGSIEGPAPDATPTSAQALAQEQHIAFAHEYTIMGLSGNTITLFNPWNKDEVTNGGQFDMAFDAYCQCFRTVTSEAQPQPE